MEMWALIASAAETDASSRQELASAMRAWVSAGGNGVPLVTCHRAELYGIGEMPRLAPAQAVIGVPAIRHLFRVAAGLESAVVGEDEVLHQVRQALREARAVGRVDYRLGRLFELATAAGRRSRAGHAGSPIGLAEEAVNWLSARVDLRRARLLVVGAGKMGAALARAAAGAGAQLTIASRDVTRASRLAALHGCDGMDLDTAAGVVSGLDAVAIALAGPWSQVGELTNDLPPVADLSAPSALPDRARSRAADFLGIDQLFTKGTPPPGYVEAASPVVDEWVIRYSGWFAERRQVGLDSLVAS